MKKVLLALFVSTIGFSTTSMIAHADDKNAQDERIINTDALKDKLSNAKDAVKDKWANAKETVKNYWEDFKGDNRETGRQALIEKLKDQYELTEAEAKEVIAKFEAENKVEATQATMGLKK